MPEQSPNMVKIKTANGLWVNTLFSPLNTQFENALSTYYNAHIEPLNFATENVRSVVNHWVTDATEGMIENFYQRRITPISTFVLISALYMNAQWKDVFEDVPELCDFYDMKQENIIGKVRMIKTESCNGWHLIGDTMYLTLGLGNGTHELVIAVSAVRKDYDPVDDLDFNEINKIVNGRVNEYACKTDDLLKVQLPVFDIYSSFGLDAHLKKLGIDMDTDFPIMISNSTEMDLFQATRVKIDKRGAIAVSATSAEQGAGAYFQYGKPFIIDSPFSFYIREKESGLVMFAGVYREPVVIK